MNVGVRVVRGPQWEWGDQDDGCVGTVVKLSQLEFCSTGLSGTVFVQWDNGFTGNYRVGKDGKFDLRILDSAPSGVKFPGVNCDECKQKGLVGTRWKCSVCEDFDLCHNCYHTDKHNINHGFMRIDCPSKKDCTVPPRALSQKEKVSGIFPGATVVRRVEEWLYGQNDGGIGGIPGTVMDDSSKQLLSSTRGSIMVLWENGETVEHNCGNNGKVAVKCITPAFGSSYYLDHLGVLEDNFIARDDASSDADEQPCDIYTRVGPFNRAAFHGGAGNFIFMPPFSHGEKVQVKLNVSTFRTLQVEHSSGWHPEMELCIGVTGTVIGIIPGTVVVLYKGLKKRWAINPEALSKKQLDVGDQVLILSDEQRIKSLQRGYGGWAHKMKEDLGKVAEVAGILNGGKVIVNVKGRPYNWTMNPRCFEAIESDSETEPVVSSDDSNDDSDPNEESHFMLQMMTNRSDLVRPELLVQFAAKNRAQIVHAIVERYPERINEKNCGKTALHLSCSKGHAEIVKILLNAGADVAAVDDDGNTPVHYSVYKKDDPHILKLLLARGPWYDLVNFKLLSVLHLAVHRQHLNCVKTLVEHGCNVNIQDVLGDTPLHDAIKLENKKIMEYLVNCKRFNFDITNEHGFDVLQFAAMMGQCFAIEKIITAAPHLINGQKTGDGFTPLHIACINGHRDAAEILIDKGGASMELKNREKHTPLVTAVSRAKISTMELLILKGANPNASGMNGETVLHWILKLITSCRMGLRDVPDFSGNDLHDAPETASIVAQLPSGMPQSIWVGAAVFLVQHGADLSQPDYSGTTPIDLMQDQTITGLLLEAYSYYSQTSKLKGKRTSPVAFQLSKQEDVHASKKSTGTQMFAQCDNDLLLASGSVSSYVSSETLPKSKTPSGSAFECSPGVNSTTDADWPNVTSGDISGKISKAECVLCSNNSADVRFMPCGHEVACQPCSLRMKKCPKCRVQITERMDGKT